MSCLCMLKLRGQYLYKLEFQQYQVKYAKSKKIKYWKFCSSWTKNTIVMLIVKLFEQRTNEWLGRLCNIKHCKEKIEKIRDNYRFLGKIRRTFKL